MSAIREAPVAFVRRLHEEFPDFVDLRWNLAVSRWEFIFRSAANRPSSIFYGWDRNPITNKPVGPDPVTGVPPFRDLTPDAQLEIIAIGKKTFLGNREDGAKDWKTKHGTIREFNSRKRLKSAADRAQNFADLIADVAKTVGRPGWLKEHGRDAQRLKAKRNQLEVFS